MNNRLLIEGIIKYGFPRKGRMALNKNYALYIFWPKGSVYNKNN